jgi:hypothetical protein
MYISFQPVVGWKAQRYRFGGFSMGAEKTSGNGRLQCSHVLRRMDKQQATAYIRKIAVDSLEIAWRLRFLEVVATELMSLHEGSIARFRIRPSQYADWQKKLDTVPRYTQAEVFAIE